MTQLYPDLTDQATPLIPCPWLYLYAPANSPAPFTPRRIPLGPGFGRVRLGRPVEGGAVPAETNGLIDARVLSRRHAEVWEEDGKMFIRDTGSANGTYLNGVRLSPEEVQSGAVRLETGDNLVLGIDVEGPDFHTIIHHKVVARVVCIFSAEDLGNVPVYGNRVSVQHSWL
ncbi:hypothetical protein FRB90_005035 [Tulasnella sp. 427]|nr:hypothetical protein FRB90_005035 [Tulasnella sp. 427]